jgi:malate dehydrogenase
VTVWGNHSATEVPDLSHALADRDSNVMCNDAWSRDQFVPTIQKRGAEIIAMSGLSSAASAAVAATDHMRDWVLGTLPDRLRRAFAIPKTRPLARVASTYPNGDRKDVRSVLGRVLTA